MPRVVRPAEPGDARLLYHWRTLAAPLVPLDDTLPLSPRPSEAELPSILEALQEWMMFWIVCDRDRPVGWFECDTSDRSVRSTRVQGWVEPADWHRRWLQANALFLISRELLAERRMRRLDATVCAAQRDLLEALVLAGFAIDGVAPADVWAAREGASGSLIQLSITRSRLAAAPGRWLFGANEPRES